MEGRGLPSREWESSLGMHSRLLHSSLSLQWRVGKGNGYSFNATRLSSKPEKPELLVGQSASVRSLSGWSDPRPLALSIQKPTFFQSLSPLWKESATCFACRQSSSADTKSSQAKSLVGLEWWLCTPVMPSFCSFRLPELHKTCNTSIYTHLGSSWPLWWSQLAAAVGFFQRSTSVRFERSGHMPTLELKRLLPRILSRAAHKLKAGRPVRRLPSSRHALGGRAEVHHLRAKTG